MTTRQSTLQPRHPYVPHSAEVRAIHSRMLAASVADSRRLVLRSGLEVQAIEAGTGEPVLHLHGSNTSSLSHLPLLERSSGIRSIAVDRPGLGLSQASRVPRERFREAAVEFVGAVLDAVECPSAVITGSSMGGTWGLWFALAHPERVRRLVLLGSAPLLPGTRPPALLRLMTTPVIGDLVAQAVKPDTQSLLRMMAVMGEGDSIIRYPDLLDSLVAAARDPVASSANRAELRAVMSGFGFRSSVRIHVDELRSLAVPTLLIWGDRDPVASVEVARTVQQAIPDAELQMLPAGHVPWLRHPDVVADLLTAAARSS